MKLIYKLLALFLICLLPVNVLATIDSTMPDNSTEIVWVESTNFTDNSTIDDSIDEIIDDEEEVTEIIADRIFCGPDGNYLQYLPTEQDMLYFAADSKAQGNYTFEQELIKLDDRIPFDTYVVNTTDGSRYTVDAVYVASNNGLGYDRLQFYSDRHYVSTVDPTPMAICKPMVIEALDGSWNMKTTAIKDYKIVYSHYGRKVVDTDPEKPEPIVPNEPTDTKPVPPHRVPSNDHIDDSVVVEDTVVNTTNDVNITETISNVTGNQENVTIEMENNSSYNTAVVGNGNSIKNIIIIISDKFQGFIGSLNINV